MSTQGISTALRRRCVINTERALNCTEWAELMRRIADDYERYGQPSGAYGDDRGNLLCTVEVSV